MKAAAILLCLAICAGLASAAGPEDQLRNALLAKTGAVSLPKGIIEISRANDDSYQGRIVGGNDPHRLDVHNPDSSRRQQLLLGQSILLGMHQDGASSWSGGTIYDPDSGRSYKCHIELIDQDHLKVRGFIGLSLLGRSQTWTRYLGASLDLSPAAH